MRPSRLLFTAVPLIAAIILISLAAPAATNAIGTIPVEGVPQRLAPSNPGSTDIALQGTMWQPERPKQFKNWFTRGWGTELKRKPTASADQWVHIGVPLLTYLEDRPQKVTYVEFCAASSNGAATKPTEMDLWDNDQLIGTYSITWPADNAYHCFGHNFGAGNWRSALGVTVLLHFANANDLIVLYKAWASIAD